MSYDAGETYDPISGYKSYKSYFKGPVLIGCEVGKHAWGSCFITLKDVEHYATNTTDGMFVWSYQKQDSPSCIDIINTFNNHSN